MKSILVVVLLVLSGCGQTINSTYNITGNNNRFVTESTASPAKSVETSLGASVAATAAVSQAGPAENSGTSEASSDKVKK